MTKKRDGCVDQLAQSVQSWFEFLSKMTKDTIGTYPMHIRHIIRISARKAQKHYFWFKVIPLSYIFIFRVNKKKKILEFSDDFAPYPDPNEEVVDIISHIKRIRNVSLL